MRIGIDCRTILNPGFGEGAGIGHYTYYLVKNLLTIDKENTYVLFFDRLLASEAAVKVVNNRPNTEIKFFPFHQYRHYLPFTYSHLLVAAFFSRENLDLLHAPATVFPLTYSGRAIVTVHDLAIYKHPEWFPRRFLGGHFFSTKILVPRCLKKAAKIIAVSENTKKDIQKLFKIPNKKITVVYEGVEEREAPAVCGLEKIACWDEVRKKYGIEKKYIFFLGTLEPRKNVVGLVGAYCYLLKKNPVLGLQYQLIIAGAKGWKYESIFEAIKECNSTLRFGAKYQQERRSGAERRSGFDTRGAEEKEGERRQGQERRKGEAVRYLGYVPHRDKIPLLTHASCFVFPSFYEGFGLPVLEAMHLGVPVITSKISSLPEVAGDAGILIDPNKTTAIAKALDEVLGNPILQEKLKTAGQQRAKEFTWMKTARGTLAVYQQALKGIR